MPVYFEDLSRLLLPSRQFNLDFFDHRLRIRLLLEVWIRARKIGLDVDKPCIQECTQLFCFGRMTRREVRAFRQVVLQVIKLVGPGFVVMD